MDDQLKNTMDAASMFHGDLVIGNHDSITLLGSAPQIKLRDYSRIISRIFLNDNEELDVAIRNILLSIDNFELLTNNKQDQYLVSNKRIKKECKEIIGNIESVTEVLKLQKIQLIKEIKLLEKLSLNAENTIQSLEECINICKKVINDRSSINNAVLISKYHNCVSCDKDNIDLWYSRLERHMNDLCLSHTIALQNKAQIQLLYKNHLIISDKISAIISTTFPAWQSQIAMIIRGDSLMHQSNSKNSNWCRFIKKYCRVNLSGKRQEVDVDSINTFNCELRKIFKETINMKHTDLSIKENIQRSFKQIERM